MLDALADGCEPRERLGSAVAGPRPDGTPTRGVPGLPSPGGVAAATSRSVVIRRAGLRVGHVDARVPSLGPGRHDPSSGGVVVDTHPAEPRLRLLTRGSVVRGGALRRRRCAGGRRPLGAGTLDLGDEFSRASNAADASSQPTVATAAPRMPPRSAPSTVLAGARACSAWTPAVRPRRSYTRRCRVPRVQGRAGRSNRPEGAGCGQAGTATRGSAAGTDFAAAASAASSMSTGSSGSASRAGSLSCA
jgi:hypothetical protein